MKSRGQLEAEVSEAVVKFEKEYMGRGPLETRTHIVEDLVLVRLKKVLTPAEQQLAQADGTQRGRTLIKQIRTELLEKGRPLLEAVVRDILGREVVSLHTDISTKTGERIIVFTLDAPPEFAGPP